MHIKGVLIVGGNSFIGINLILGFLKRNIDVKVFSRNTNYFHANILKEVDVMKGDLRNCEDITKALINIDVAIYLASTSNVSTSMSDIFLDNQNVSHFLNFMENVRNSNIKKVVFASSGGTVYGEPTYLPIDENHPLKPVSPYGITKVTIENYLHFYKYKYGIDYTVCRYSNPYGRYQNPLKRVGAINYFLFQHLTNKTIEIYGDPKKIIRDYIYIDDLVEITVLLALKDDLTFNVYNIGSGKGFSLEQITKELGIITQKEVNFVCNKQRNEHVQQVILNIERVIKELNWTPKVDLQTGIILNKIWIEEFLSTWQ
jgi:UDP-glucose 4-epimerase